MQFPWLQTTCECAGLERRHWDEAVHWVASFLQASPSAWKPELQPFEKGNHCCKRLVYICPVDEGRTKIAIA